jgi:VanZ family protein
MLLNEPIRRWLRIVWVLAIIVDIVGSLLPADSLPMRTLDKLDLSDKLEHIAMYAAIAVLPAIHERRLFVIAASVGAIALGVALEFAQLFTGWRDFEYGDMVASGLGVGIGVTGGIFARAMLRRLMRNHEPQDRFTRHGLVTRAR